MTVVSWAAFAFLQLMWIPDSKRKYDEFGLSLPGWTKTAFGLNGLILDWGLGFILPLLAFLAMVPLAVLVRDPKRRAVYWLWLALLILPPALVSAGCIVAVGLPLVKLGEGLAK